jgi:pimeloyl-ACP methyl ester carboxylesterase
MYPKLHFKILGQGRPVIILHGLFGMSDNWLTIARKLEENGFMPILIDLRDHGRSDHTQAFSYPLLSEDLLHFMEEHHIFKADIIGHSMGGKVGLQFANENESMVSSLIVVDMGIKRYDRGHDSIFSALKAIPIDTMASRHQAEKILVERLKDISTVQFLMKNLSRNKDGGFHWKMNLNLLIDNYENILRQIEFEHICQTKTLFIKGGLSDYILEKDEDDILKVLPNASFCTIPLAGHWVHADQPDELFSEIIDFYKQRI